MKPARIRFTPKESSLPLTASLPLENTLRWVSPHDEADSPAAVTVFLTQVAYVRAASHAASEMENEVGGVLVGKWCLDAETGRQFIVAVGALPASFTQNSRVYLTFTQDSLVDIHSKIDLLYPGQEIVGWYHTHPRMGIFLSHYDTWLHEHFFPEPWQVALVIEPHARIGGFFVRREGGELDPSRYSGFYELDGSSGHSVVEWKNLREDIATAENNGGFVHE